jgi:hypothetical protein
LNQAPTYRGKHVGLGMVRKLFTIFQRQIVCRKLT